MITLNSQRSIEYVSSGLFRSNGKWCHPERVIDTFELMLVLKGEVYISEGDEEYRLSENELLLLSPDVYHKGIRESEGVSFYWMHFKASEVPPLKNVVITEPSSIKSMFSELMHITNTEGYSKDSYDLICALILEEALFCNRQKETCGSALISQVREYIRLNIKKGVTLDGVARHFGYHANYLGQLFIKSMGVGMKEYITSSKIKLAAELLTTTLDSVKEISARLGFRSENNFIKFFKYHTMTTPAKYRSAHANTHINDH